MELPRFHTSSRGFTLIELMVVMTVIAILATMALFGLGKAQASARDTQRQQIMTGIQTALERYYGDNGTYPNTNFSGLFASSGATSLVANSYIISPTDPKCTGALTAVWSPCTPTVLPTYRYTPTCAAGSCQAYVLRLDKESGGISNFNSPQ